MTYTIQPPTTIHADIGLPASKSISNRILILKALSNNKNPVENLSDSEDTQVLKKALFSIQTGNTVFDVGAAGTSMRFLTAFLAQTEGIWTITGSERMKNRPIKILVDSLREIGGKIDFLEKKGFPPLQITGRKLVGGAIRLNSEVSSQYLSALMMIAPCTQNGLDIVLEGNIISMPYISMTARLMQTFGIKTLWNGRHIKIEPQNYKPVPFMIENDWSAASYWYEIVALAENPACVKLTGLEQNSIQGDAKVSELFTSPPAPLLKEKGEGGSIIIQNFLNKQSSPLSFRRGAGGEVDFTNEPDLAQTLAVTCCLLDIPFHFTGLQSLRIKETDRISALQTELKKLGYIVKASENTLKWEGEKCNPDTDPVISTYDDHRMAMAFAPVCLRKGKIRINNPDVVSKSYPAFWKDLVKAGFTVKKTDY